MFGMIWFHSVKCQTEIDFSDICFKLFHCFSLSFLTCFVNGRKLSKYLVDKIILALSAHKSNKIYNKIQNIWFPLPTYSVLQLRKKCIRKNVVLLNFCLCVYVYANTHLVWAGVYLHGGVYLHMCKLTFTYMQLRSHAQKYTRVQIIHICIIYTPCVNQRMWTGL